MEIFQTFAEISIGILGFTAIVIMFRQHHSKWNNSMYQGMIGHSIQALVYSILPFILDAYHCSPARIWTIGSIFLGSVTALQGIAVMLGDKNASLKIRVTMLTFSLSVAVLQFFNVAGIWSQQEKGPYIIGITWHILQALFIFSMIVGKKIENDSKSDS